jgi:thioesterase domain-containing protein/acyl carrier protein
VDALARVLPSTIVYNLYGPTETTTYSTFTRVVRGEKVTIGRPIAHTRVYVLDPRGQPAPPGVAGELFIGGRGVARGYYGRADLTAERFVADPFVTDSAARMYRTGDLCRWRSDGVLEYLGRLDRQVKIRGFRIELPEIEAVLGRQPEVRACTVVAREDVPGDKRLVAYAESTRPDVDAWRAALAKALPDYMVPSAIVTLDRLPLTPNGKVDQKRLPPPTNVAVSAASASTALASDTERRLAAIWQTLLSVPTVSRTDGFFALGGHSLLAMRLVHEVHEQFGVALAPVALLQHQVLADLATAIDGMRQTSTREVLVQIAPGGGGTPFFWVHGIGGEVFSYLQLSRHLGRSRPVYGFAADWSQIGQGQPVTLETIAGCYVERLKQAQPVGPYHLGGFCAATLLALEIARQLEARGDQVGVLVGIDGNVLSESDDALRPKSPLLAFLRNLPRWFVEDARPSGAADMFGRIRSGWHRLQARIRRQPRAGAAGAQGPNDIRDVLGMWRFPDHQRPMLEVHHRAIRAYHPRPCQAHVLLLLPRTAPVLGPWPTGYDPEWDRLALGGLTVREVRGSHSTMLGDPFALELSVAIDRCIDQIEARRQPTAGRAGSQVSALRTSIHPSTAL